MPSQRTPLHPAFLVFARKKKTPKPNGSDVFAIGGDKRDRTADLLNAIDGADMLIHFLTFYFILFYPSQIT